MQYFARGGGGAHASVHVSAPHVSAPRVSAPAPKPAAPRTTTTRTTTKTSTTRTTAKPKTTAQKLTATGAKGKAATTKPKQTTINGHRLREPVTVTHQHFYHYSAPAGSVVYYPQYSPMDYLPWIYLFSQNSPQHQQAVVVQPDGKQVQVTPQKGVDGMLIFNWILLVVVALAAIGGIVWLVNKKTQK